MKGATGGVSDVSGVRYKFAPTEGTVFVRTKAGTEVVITHSNPTMSTQVQPQPSGCRVDKTFRNKQRFRVIIRLFHDAFLNTYDM